MGRPRKDEQLDLIEVSPENQKTILRLARAYLEAKKECGIATENAKNKKNRLREAILEANLQPLEDGVIRVVCGEHMVEVVPRDEEVSVKSAPQPKEAAKEGASCSMRRKSCWNDSTNTKQISAQSKNG